MADRKGTEMKKPVRKKRVQKKDSKPKVKKTQTDKAKDVKEKQTDDQIIEKLAKKEKVADEDLILATKESKEAAAIMDRTLPPPGDKPKPVENPDEEKVEIPEFDDPPTNQFEPGAVDVDSEEYKESTLNRKEPDFVDEVRAVPPQPEVGLAQKPEVQPQHKEEVKRETPEYEDRVNKAPGQLNYKALLRKLNQFVKDDQWCRERKIRIVESIPGRKLAVKQTDGVILASYREGKRYGTFYSMPIARRFRDDDVLKRHFR